LRIKSKEILIQENQNLLSQQKINSSILQRYESLEQENERLKQILNAANNLDNKVEITRIISVNVNPYRHTIVIDKGERDGVYNGQVLLDADGVIGQILHTNFLTSEAILISDSDHALPVEINRNGLRTIVLGNGSFTKLDVPYIPNNADIEIGDLLVTSGLGGKFPSGYPVAKVDFIESDLSEQFYKVSAKPIAYLNQVREVMLLKPE
jgi:rod shape-determining protein MreC